MLTIKEVSFLKKLAIKYKIEELDNFIKIQEKKIKEENGKVVISIKEKRKEDKFYAREYSRVSNYMKSKHKKIIKNIENGEIIKAQEMFNEESKVLNKHNAKALYEFLNMFTDKEIEILKK